mmetsp:Transcript_22024/g.61731  ORF Transcript_22024/g.61731 Transcript_22024/m.61731 type:complete len:423 (+) Transcript_22024:735-2003(+)
MRGVFGSAAATQPASILPRAAMASNCSRVMSTDLVPPFSATMKSWKCWSVRSSQSCSRTAGTISVLKNWTPTTSGALPSLTEPLRGDAGVLRGDVGTSALTSFEPRLPSGFLSGRTKFRTVTSTATFSCALTPLRPSSCKQRGTFCKRTWPDSSLYRSNADSIFLRSASGMSMKRKWRAMSICVTCRLCFLRFMTVEKRACRNFTRADLPGSLPLSLTSAIWCSVMHLKRLETGLRHSSTGLLTMTVVFIRVRTRCTRSARIASRPPACRGSRMPASRPSSSLPFCLCSSARQRHSAARRLCSRLMSSTRQRRCCASSACCSSRSARTEAMFPRHTTLMCGSCWERAVSAISRSTDSPCCAGGGSSERSPAIGGRCSNSAGFAGCGLDLPGTRKDSLPYAALRLAARFGESTGSSAPGMAGK